MRLIDADALDDVITRLNFNENWGITRGEYKLINSVIFEFSTVDAVPVRHGKWIDRNGAVVAPFWERYECSECGARSDNSKYCPNCGADMRGEEHGLQ